ncbi:unnamed protein product [Photorhabdus laumondii subsp. laumondii TTO1]|uniref:Photorhabdus luminescens subsp. laumondii TTO1 complete genome segment 2/17 n=1 Tax=Photorhabdus laumondii subsp. laumondii (strain DSM 15139 / CIP 105565 / TT01) TaxID=243265 RepID=Q7N8W4_PHOLL|nr:unnamed protein product [Photorhabdus laumondii subsp. laumondii TTO1]
MNALSEKYSLTDHLMVYMMKRFDNITVSHTESAFAFMCADDFLPQYPVVSRME